MLRGVLVLLLGLLFGLAVTAGPASAHTTAGSAVAAEADHGHDHAALHEQAIHHSHGLGEDTYHQKASHCSLDFPFDGKAQPFARASTASFKIVAADESAHGIVLAPPVPPPLG